MCSDYIILGKQSVGVGCVVGCVGREQPAPCWPCAPASRDWGAGSESAAPQLGLDLVCPPCFERGSPTRAGLDSPTWTGPRLTSSAPAAGVLPPFYSDLVSAQKKIGQYGSLCCQCYELTKVGTFSPHLLVVTIICLPQEYLVNIIQTLDPT